MECFRVMVSVVETDSTRTLSVEAFRRRFSSGWCNNDVENEDGFGKIKSH